LRADGRRRRKRAAEEEEERESNLDKNLETLTWQVGKIPRKVSGAS